MLVPGLQRVLESATEGTGNRLIAHLEPRFGFPGRKPPIQMAMAREARIDGRPEPSNHPSGDGVAQARLRAPQSQDADSAAGAATATAPPRAAVDRWGPQVGVSPAGPDTQAQKRKLLSLVSGAQRTETRSASCWQDSGRLFLNFHKIQKNLSWV